MKVGDETFSPCYKWDKNLRAGMSWKPNVHDNFRQRGKIYCYLREHCDESEFSNPIGVGQLKVLAAAAFKEEDGAADPPTAQLSEKAAGKKKMKVEWAARAMETARRNAEFGEVI